MNALRSRQSGFTGIELMIAISIVAILAALALPSFKTAIENGQIRAATDVFHEGMQLARATAIQRNTRVCLETADAVGWTVRLSGVDACDGASLQTRTPENTARVSFDVVDTGGKAATVITFNSLGRVVSPNPDGSNPIASVDVSVDKSNAGPLRVTVGPGGAIRLCDPHAASGDVRACT